MEEAATQYWLFQTNEQTFQLVSALKVDALQSFEVRAHRDLIAVGDKVIIWKTGESAGVYALATVISEVAELPISEAEQSFYIKTPKSKWRVRLQVDYNLWNEPITKDNLTDNTNFEAFYAGLPGVNYRATKAQYEAIVHLVQLQNSVQEPTARYQTEERLHYPLNQLFYGAPGTGKTYQAVTQAIAIVEHQPLVTIQQQDRAAVQERFQDYLSLGRIQMVSFHPSFSYEDFVEGIKPTVVNGQVQYQVEDGIFKRLVTLAQQSLLETYATQNAKQSQLVSFGQTYKAYLDYLKSNAFEKFDSVGGKSDLIFHGVQRFGNIEVRRANSYAVETVLRNRLKRLYQQIAFPEQIEPSVYKSVVRQLLGVDNPSTYWTIFSHFKAFSQHYQAQLEAAATEEIPELNMMDLDSVPDAVLENCHHYVLIIDEINRGNVAGIFGELISLIEPDKRMGMPEMLTTILPYSKTYFGIPPNVSIIGTMNVSDRSITPLDLALRRRFEFTYFPPQPEAIPEMAKQPITAGIDLSKLLKAINRRITVLLGRDYCIGHAYFLNIESFDDLKSIFKTQIIPLLQTYFFNDYAKIGLVLGKSFIVEEEFPADNFFAPFDHEYANEWTNKRLFALRAIEELNEEDFREIYNNT